MNEAEFNAKVKNYIAKADASGTPKSVQASFISDRRKEFMDSQAKVNERYKYMEVDGKIAKIDNETGNITWESADSTDGLSGLTSLENSLSSQEGVKQAESSIASAQQPTFNVDEFNAGTQSDYTQPTQQTQPGQTPSQTKSGLSIKNKEGKFENVSQEALSGLDFGNSGAALSKPYTPPMPTVPQVVEPTQQQSAPWYKPAYWANKFKGQ